MNKPEILIVEDDKAIKNLISTTLELEGYRYHTAENGAQVPEALLLLSQIFLPR